MNFFSTKIDGVTIIEIDKKEDHRGFFARTFCTEEFRKNNLPSNFVQQSISFNTQKGTLRGMHFQKKPHEEGKLVSCIQGKIFDVIADIRPASPTYKHWVSIELSSTNFKAIYIAPGLAHGFQTLEDNSCVHYQMTKPYVPQAAAGFLYSDPTYGIEWPIDAPTMSISDQQLNCL